MKKISVMILAGLALSVDVLSQTCIVKQDSLQGQYTGGCKKGMADGQGTATGAAIYSGAFKNGYPEGFGKYTWRNGDWYEGFWKEGKYEGKGTLSRKAENTSDSLLILTGYWRAGKYIGIHEKPYAVEQLTNNINDVSVRKLSNKNSDINITVKSITGGASILNRPELPKPAIVDIQILQGRYEQLVADTVSKIANRYSLRKAVFPFVAIFTIHTEGPTLYYEKARVELYEDGNWSIRFDINN